MKRILFIGNSHTYYHDMVATFKEICDSHNQPVMVTMLAHAGVSLLWHSEEPEVRFNILYGNYDYIVLQDAAHPFIGIEKLNQALHNLSEFIENTKSKVVMYQTWCQQDQPENQEVMSQAYATVANNYDALLVPVGNHWQKVKDKARLYDDDGQHASALGAFLTANIFYNYLFGNVKDIDEEKIVDEFGEGSCLVGE